MEKLPWRGDESDPRCVILKARLRDAIQSAYDTGIRHFLCGMATGCDLYFCEAVLALRAMHEDVTLEAAIPYEKQSSGWSEELRDRYNRLVSECDYQTVVQKEYTPDCMMRRNRYMVDNAGMLIACYDDKAGGTQKTMLYALRQGLTVVQIPV